VRELTEDAIRALTRSSSADSFLVELGMDAYCFNNYIEQATSTQNGTGFVKKCVDMRHYYMQFKVRTKTALCAMHSKNSIYQIRYFPVSMPLK
jgi:hypothetical protein